MLIRINQFSRTFPLGPQNLNYGDASPLTPTLKIIESSSLLNYNVKNIGSFPLINMNFKTDLKTNSNNCLCLPMGPCLNRCIQHVPGSLKCGCPNYLNCGRHLVAAESLPWDVTDGEVKGFVPPIWP
jgi:hypothetical protein